MSSVVDQRSVIFLFCIPFPSSSSVERGLNVREKSSSNCEFFFGVYIEIISERMTVARAIKHTRLPYSFRLQLSSVSFFSASSISSKSTSSSADWNRNAALAKANLLAGP